MSAMYHNPNDRHDTFYTHRDICAYDAAGYAEVLIPFLANLLGSVELYASSICTIIETMNLTVEAQVVEPRAGKILSPSLLFCMNGFP